MVAILLRTLGRRGLVNSSFKAFPHNDLPSKGIRTNFARLLGLLSVSTSRKYYTATKANTEVNVEDELLHADQLLVDEGMEAFAQCPEAYTNYNIQDISFEINPRKERNNIQILHKGQPIKSHLTPWASVSFALMGPRGDSGATFQFMNPELQNAKQSIGICTLPRHVWEDKNEDMVSYIHWLNQVALKYRAFLETNYKDIPVLQRKYRGRNPHQIKTMLAGDLIDPVKSKYDESTQDNYQSVVARRFMFVKATKVPDLTLDCDTEIYSKYGLVPWRAPIYDSHNTIIPLTEDRPVQRGDVVSVLVDLSPYAVAFNDGRVLIGFQISLISVTILMAKRFSGVRRTYPFQGMGDVGGWIYQPDQWQ